MKKITDLIKPNNNLINESAPGKKIIVVYAISKSGEDPKLRLMDRITLGIYDSESKATKCLKEYENAIQSIKGYENYEVYSYESYMNYPLVEIEDLLGQN